MNSLRAAGYIFLALCAIIIFASVQTNSVIKQQLRQSKKETIQQASKSTYHKPFRKEPGATGVAERKIKPEDPTKYGMAVLARHNEAQTLEQWEIKLTAEFDRHGFFESESAKQILAQIDKDYAQHEQQMLTLDEEINEVDQKLKADPLNDSLEKQLQNLYKLKAVNRILERKVFPPSDRPIVPSPETPAPALE